MKHVIVVALAAGALLAGCGDEAETIRTENGSGATAGTSGGSTSTGGMWPGGNGGTGASGATGGSGAGSGVGGVGGSSGTGSGGATVGDPCDGASDGAHCGDELGAGADHNSLYVCKGSATESAQACDHGCASAACNAPPADPCESEYAGNGAYCGAGLTGGDSNKLYDCQNKTTAGTTDCPNGCEVNPPGVADKCAESSGGDPCSGASSGTGDYCGSGLPGGDPNKLYTCANQATSNSVTCPNGCQVMPAGTSDRCAPVTGGQCCLERPPGALTQAFTACDSGSRIVTTTAATVRVGTRSITSASSPTVAIHRTPRTICTSTTCTSARWRRA